MTRTARNKSRFKDLLKKASEKPWYFKLYYWKIKPKLDKIESEVRSWPFRLRNGFDYRDTWSLDYNIAKYTLPRLKYLRKRLMGWPIDLTFKEWKKAIDHMIYTFEKLTDEDYLYNKRTEKKIQEGLELFGKYFRHLWD